MLRVDVKNDVNDMERRGLNQYSRLELVCDV